MVFSIQRYIEDFLVGRGLNDKDQYAVRLANLYESTRASLTKEDFLARVHRLRAVQFRNAPHVDRKSVESLLLTRLDQQFLKKKAETVLRAFPGGTVAEAIKLRRTRRSVSRIMELFHDAIEARAIDTFWKSRTTGKLNPRPEKIGQGLFAVFVKGVLQRSAYMARELASGVGFVDFAIMFSTIPHLVEVKVLRSDKLLGVSQLGHYMRIEKRREGWLLLFDARPHDKRDTLIPVRVVIPEGTVRVEVVDINPIAPSRS